MSEEEEVIYSCPYFEGDSRWEGVVEVVRRRLPDEVVHINVRLRRGNKVFYLPRHRDMKEFFDAIEGGVNRAQEEYRKLFRKLNE